MRRSKELSPHGDRKGLNFSSPGSLLDPRMGKPLLPLEEEEDPTTFPLTPIPITLFSSVALQLTTYREKVTRIKFLQRPLSVIHDDDQFPASPRGRCISTPPSPICQEATWNASATLAER